MEKDIQSILISSDRTLFLLKSDFPDGFLCFKYQLAVEQNKNYGN